MKAAAIIVAGGAGKRFGSAKPKQFLNLCGKPVFLWSIEAFSSIKDFKQIIVVVPDNMLDSLSKKYKNISFTSGGKERFDSVKKGLLLINKDIDFIAVHDGARPLIHRSDIIKVLKEASVSKAAIAAQKTKDTVKEVKNGYIINTLDRSRLWNAQTPQIFERDILLKAYSKKINAAITDDSQLVEKLNIKVAIVETKFPNFKITTPDDMLFAEKELKQRKK